MKDETIKNNTRINDAIIFAVEKHAGQLRKGTDRPYILHPLEVLTILNSMRADTDLLIAGLLHDTLEDTDATPEMIEARFGKDVVELVSSHSEDKSKTWEERKGHAIDELAKEDKRTKMLVMADKLSNLRSMATDYRQIGDELWDRFNRGPDKQAWYYGGALEALSSLGDDPQCAAAFRELQSLYGEIFSKYSYAPEGV